MSTLLLEVQGAPLVIPTFTGDYFWLSNFYARPLMFTIGGVPGQGIRFPMSEHAYQAGKAKALVNPHEAEAFITSLANEPDPTKAKHIARKAKIDVEKWDRMKDMVMREVVFEKFVQHRDLRDKLLETHTAMLVEGNTWGDKYWGRVDGKGLNHLGVILMEVRGYFHFHDVRGGVRLRPPIDNIIAG